MNFLNCLMVNNAVQLVHAGPYNPERIATTIVKTNEAGRDAYASAVARHFRSVIRGFADRLEDAEWHPMTVDPGAQANELVNSFIDLDEWREDLRVNTALPLAAIFASGAAAELELHRSAVAQEKLTSAEEIAERLAIELPAEFAFGEMPEWLLEAATAAAQEVFEQDYWLRIPETTRDDIERILTESIRDGGSIQRIVRAIRELAEAPGRNYSRTRATAIARTECLVGSIQVDAANILAGHRRNYRGDVCEIVTDAGNEFAGTPNHPMLTITGWKPLGSITEGDYLIGYDGNVESASPTCDKNVDQPPAAICQVLESLAAVGVSKRMRTGQPDFHGDGMQGYVDVFLTNGVLRHGSFAPVAQRQLEKLLPPALVRQVLLSTFSKMFPERSLFSKCDTLICAAQSSACSDNGGAGISRRHAVCRRELTRAPARLVLATHFVNRQVFGKRPIAGTEQFLPRLLVRAHHSSSQKCAANGIRSGVDFNRDFAIAHPGQVKIYRVLRTFRRQNISCQVYNLSTKEGYFLANGLYTGNTSNMLNAGHVAGIEQIQDEIGEELTKIWVSVLGSTTRATHAAMDGSEVPVRNGMFSLAGIDVPYPAHYSLPAADRVNCQCSVISGFAMAKAQRTE